ncbi:hypothetical protein WCT97_19955, partial [Pectobacterium versatile]
IIGKNKQVLHFEVPSDLKYYWWAEIYDEKTDQYGGPIEEYELNGKTYFIVKREDDVQKEEIEHALK